MRQNRQLRALKMIGASLFFLFCFSFAVFLGYYINLSIYRKFGQPPIFMSHVLAAVTGVILIFIVMNILRLTFLKGHSQEGEQIRRNIYEVLEEISKGNFDVILDNNIPREFEDLVDAVNDMAKNLGSLETMREDFISNVSHEIQSPLTSISGFAKLMKDRNTTDKERFHYAEIIENESRRLSSLSENLLKLSTLEKVPLNLTTYRLDKQVQQIALFFEPQWTGKNINMEADLASVTLWADQDLIRQAITNLINNAIKFTPEGGTIHLVVTEEKFAVEDTGIGISEDDQIHIFERFYKVDKARDRQLGGNGLGLSIVKKIVDQHQGRLLVYSKVGQGTRFEIQFPKKK